MGVWWQATIGSLLECHHSVILINLLTTVCKIKSHPLRRVHWVWSFACLGGIKQDYFLLDDLLLPAADGTIVFGALG